MNIPQPSNGRNPSNNLRCPHCHTQLLTQAVFCSLCGEQVKKIGDWERRAENGDYDAQDHNDNTVRVASLAQKHWERWKSYQSLKNTSASEQTHTNSLHVQAAETLMPSPVEAKSTETESMDTLVRPLPATPVPAIAETWQQVPDTEVPASTSNRSNRLWPIIIIISAVAASLVNFVFTDIAIRPIIVFWFLAVCPGMVFVRFLRLKEPVVEWTLALALSFSIDALVAGTLLYARMWSPTAIFGILIAFTLGGAIVQLMTRRAGTLVIASLSQWYNRMLQPRYLLKTVSLILLLGISLGGIGLSIIYQNSRATNPAPIQAAKPTAHFSPTATKGTLPTPMPAMTIASSYYGALHDISTGTTTNISLIRIKQQQGNITGYFDIVSPNSPFNGVSRNTPFTGTINNARRIQFVVKSDTNRVAFSFDGMIQSDGTIQGSYCGSEGAAKTCSNYGLGTLSPGS